MGVTKNLLPLGLSLASAATAAAANPEAAGFLPSLGWNSWNEYASDINESVILDTAQLIVDLGLKDLGYEYVNIDDAWSDKDLRRDNVTKEIIVDKVKFPRGIDYVAKRIHELGLKVGIYSNAGTSTCGGFEASLGYEEIDAATFAKWGIDYLKYDNCAVPEAWWDDYKYVPENWRGGPGWGAQADGSLVNSKTDQPPPLDYDWSQANTRERYQRMHDALKKQDREILYACCNWGHADLPGYADETNLCSHFRAWGDIGPDWLGNGEHFWIWNLIPILNHASYFWFYTDHGHHMDWDMMEVGNGNLTYTESRTHFALWAALRTPLLIGTRLIGIEQEILDILSNKELLAFNQDLEFGKSAQPYRWSKDEAYVFVDPFAPEHKPGHHKWDMDKPAEYWVGDSAKGKHIFVLNLEDNKSTREIKFDEIPGLDASKKYIVHDMWTGKDIGAFKGSFEIDIEEHDTIALRLNEVKCPSKKV